MDWLTERRRRKEDERQRENPPPYPSGSAAAELYKLLSSRQEAGARVGAGRKTLRIGHDEDRHVYAFVSQGSTQAPPGVALPSLKKTLPGIIAQASGVSPDIVAVIRPQEYIPGYQEGADAPEGQDAQPYPDALCDCIHDWLDNRGLYGHQLSDQQLMGILDEDNKMAVATDAELKAQGRHIAAPQLLFSAWLCFPNELM